jgi:hypothetical protein
VGADGPAHRAGPRARRRLLRPGPEPGGAAARGRQRRAGAGVAGVRGADRERPARRREPGGARAAQPQGSAPARAHLPAAAPGPADAFPPLRSLQSFAHNLPVQLTSLSGASRSSPARSSFWRKRAC